MQIRLACHPNSFGRFGPEAAIRLLPELGVPNIELPIKTAGVASPFGETPVLTNASDPDEVAAVRDRIEQAGLGICSCNITSGNPLLPEIVEITLTKLQLVRDIGAPLVVAGGGEFHSPDEERQLVRHLQQIANAAQELGIIYCCETHPGACQNSRSMLRLLEQVNHPSIRINFDTANVLYYNEGLDVASELQAVLPLVRHVHLKDSNGKYRDWYFPSLGDGRAIDFGQIRDILSAAGYDGPCSLEIEGFQNEHSLPLTDYERRLKDSLRHLHECGFRWAQWA